MMLYLTFSTQIGSKWISDDDDSDDSTRLIIQHAPKVYSDPVVQAGIDPTISTP
jgi:hypothetical protein